MTRNSSNYLNREARRSMTAPALGMTLLLALAACGGGDEPAQSSPTALSSSPEDDTQSSPESEGTTSDAEPTTEEPTGASEGEGDTDSDDETQPEGGEPDAWATFTEEPPPVAGSQDFTDDPRAQVVSRFNEELARAATADNPDRPEWLATLNEDNIGGLMDNFSDEFGRTYPGPLPYEILDIEDLEDGTASVQGCMVTDGFSVSTAGEGEGMTGIVVSSIEYSLVEDPDSEGAWLVDAIFAGAYNCSSTSVEARTW